MNFLLISWHTEKSDVVYESFINIYKKLQELCNLYIYIYKYRMHLDLILD